MARKSGAENIKWDLSDLFTELDDTKISNIMKISKNKSSEFAKKYKGSLSTLSPKELHNCYKQIESILEPVYKIGQYIHLIYSVDTSNEIVKARQAKIEKEESTVQNTLIFFELELAKIPVDRLKALEKDPELTDYRYSLERTRKTAQYNLSEKEEQLINLKDLTGENAFIKLYEELTSSFEFEFEVDGKKQKMNGSELRSLRLHENSAVRRSAMKMFFEKYQENKLVLTHIFNNIIRDYNIEKDLRGYKSAIEIRNSHNDLDNKSIEVLHEITTKSYKLVQRYYKLKAKIINIPDITLADIYAPMPENSKTYTWSESKKIVLDAFKAFDQEIYDMANSMFLENRIDAPVKKNKTGGAYCSSSTPDIKPYVLLNFLGKQRDVATLAHELGHAVHSIYCSKQNLSNFHPVLPLAETASIFSEMLVTDYFLKTETDKTARTAIISDKLENIFASSHRQNMFSLFEMETHKNIPDNLMSFQSLCELYSKQLKLMFGTSVKQPAEYKFEWAAIPHIFEWPFYVYSYNFANLLVIALYQKYLEDGDSFIPLYKHFLSMGSSTKPENILAIMKVDIKDPAFWEKSLIYIDKLITQLEDLV
ncbi:MAG: M3 family oligoendopeptidase [bacterium]|nr:M3 family oligoendopeptidase [bacterium]